MKTNVLPMMFWQASHEGDSNTYLYPWREDVVSVIAGRVVDPCHHSDEQEEDRSDDEPVD